MPETLSGVGMKILLMIFVGILLLSVSAVSELTYEDMARYPDQNVGESVNVFGQVAQVDYTSEEGWAFRLNTKKAAYIDGYIGDDVMVYFSGKPEGGRLLVGDIVAVQGSFYGPFAYNTVLGETREIPLISGTFYKLQHGNF